jgi:hypothetical protein
LIAEATFFSGYKLQQRLITVSQMARHFSRLARQPWKLSVADAQSLGQAPVVKPEIAKQVDALLEQTSGMEVHLEEALAASLDEVYGEGEAYVDTGPVLVSGVVEDAVMATQESVKILLPRDAAESVSRVVMEAAAEPKPEPEPVKVKLNKATPSPLPEAEPRPAKKANPFAKRSVTDKMIALGLAKPKKKTKRVVAGRVRTKTGPVKVLGITLEKTEPDPLIIDPVAVVTPSVSQFRSRPKTAVPARPSQAPLDQASRRNFRLLTRLRDMFGEADDGVALAIEAVSDDLAKATERDSLGQATVDGLGEEYERAAIFTLSGPRAVVWRCKIGGLEAKNVIGKTIEIQQGALLHRIAEERVFYFGPLSKESKLRRVLGIDHSNDLLIAPIELRGKTILILLLDAGDRPFPSPGGYIERLLSDISKGLERVILMRKRGRRKSNS